MTKSPGPQIEIDTGEPRNLTTRLLGLALVISAVVLATYLVVAYAAWESGRKTQAENESQTQALAHQVDLARSDITAGSVDLAMRRLDWVLEQDSGYSAALALRSEVQATIDAAAVVRPTETPAPTEEPVATEEATVETDSLPELQEIRLLTAREAWDEALPLLLDFQQRNPDYERQETDELLFETYLNLGLVTIEGDGIELGLNYLAQAERLGNLPQEAQDYRYWGNLYLDGIAYYGVNWDVAGYYFRDLCAAAPFFQNSCQLLTEVMTKQAEQLAFAGDWCPAEEIYQELWQQDRGFADQLTQARENCALATPVPITDTVDLTGTLPITDVPPGE
ncbi:MAG: hypothetical protein R3C44_00825 [Chloroflexota bacterium]